MAVNYNGAIYDAYLSDCVEQAFYICEPVQLEPESKHHSASYNCSECDDEQCEHWQMWNADKETCTVCGKYTNHFCYDCDKLKCQSCKCDCTYELEKCA